MIYIESPKEYVKNGEEISLFLAGGITGCPDWQKQMVDALPWPEGLVLLNPRRANFPIGDPGAALAQITWEFEHLRLASAISFWFPKETLCPIVLYELGAWSMTSKPIFVGVEPGYKRQQDVEIQTRLARPRVEIVYSLDLLIDSVEAAFGGGDA